VNLANPTFAGLQKHLSWVNLILLLVLMPLITTNSCSRPEEIVGEEATSPSALKEDTDVALGSAEEMLQSGDYSGAFDMLMVASRLAPSDPSLFDLVVRFVEQASSSESEDALAMSEDLLDRADSLIYFQAPQNVQAARIRLKDLQQKFLASEPTFEPPQPLDAVMQFVSVAQDATNPTSVRTRAAEQARSLLGDLQLQIAIGEQAETEQLSQAAVAELLQDIDTSEQQCIEILFAELSPRLNVWQSAARQLLEKAGDASLATAPELMQSLSKTAGTGFELLQELMPYSKSGIKNAIEMSNESEAIIRELRRQENWLYNKQSLARIREAETAKERTPKEKLGALALIQEEKLTDYVLRRLNEVWGKIFEELPNEDEKVNAVRMRILGVNK